MARMISWKRGPSKEEQSEMTYWNGGEWIRVRRDLGDAVQVTFTLWMPSWWLKIKHWIFYKQMQIEDPGYTWADWLDSFRD